MSSSTSTSVLNSLKNSSKGQLSYSRHYDKERLKDDLDILSSPPLSRTHEERNSSYSSLNGSLGLDSSTNQDFNDNSTDTAANSSDHLQQRISQLLSNFDDEIEKQDSSKEDVDVFDTSLPDLNTSSSVLKDGSSTSPSKKQTNSCPVSPQFGITTSAILDEEAMWDSVAQYRILQRSMKFDGHERAMSYLMKSKKDALDLYINRQVEKRNVLVKQKEDECLAATQSKLQQLKEDHQNHQKKIHVKQQEIERQKQKLEEEERLRQEQELSRLNEFKSLAADVLANRNTFVKTLESCILRENLPEVIEKYRFVLDKICTNMEQQLSSGSVISDELISKAKEHKEKSHQVVLFLKKQIAEAEETEKNKENQKQEEEKRIEEQKKLVAEAAQDLRVQSLAYVLKEYEANSKLLAEVDKTVQAFTSNVDMKKFRFDIQRAVNTPINAISPVNGSHLHDKLKRLHALLVGQPVEVANKQVSLGNSKEGKIFCENLVAKMLVKKGEEQVTSNHESAFAIALVIVGLWVEIPVIGDLFLAHLQSFCPYILPLHNTRKEGQSLEDYHKSLGYKIMEDKSVEEQDKFLHRMSGLMHLYCACIVTTPPKGPNCPHPLGLEHAWMWLARTMNMEPQPDVTASMVYDVLFVTGHFLYQEYQFQFAKMLQVLYKNYLPKLRNVSVTKSTVGRLEIFLETALQKGGRIDPPKGLLPPNFLMS